jgi:hypothetical protein
MTYYAPGIYKCRIVAQRFDRTSNGNPRFNLEIVPMVDGQDGPYTRSIRWTITDKTVKYVNQKLERLGFRGSSYRELDESNGASFHNFAGLEISAQCQHNDKGYEDWDLPKEGGSDSPKLPPNERRDVGNQLDALFGKTLRKTNPQASPAKSPPVAPKPTAAIDPAVVEAAGDDEIPF